jgi:hypothetical protein
VQQGLRQILSHAEERMSPDCRVYESDWDQTGECINQTRENVSQTKSRIKNTQDNKHKLKCTCVL